MTHDTANAGAGGDTGSQQTDTPRIYAACLAAYNNGHLHGCWIDATQDSDAIQVEISAMLAASPVPNAEEWAIHDYEGYEGARLEEYSGIEKAHALALFIVERGKLGAKLLQHFGGDLDEAEAAFENYAGQHADLAAFAEHLAEETGAPISDSIAPYVDYRAMGRDLELGGDIFTVELGFGELHVFWSR
ncbi:MAG: antirestriction protein ArdA [Roseitalea porphyridii]|jgi:antirestriction protein|uniref:antirestriction protein ArdA n=1 Tax=Roseitalea porphyridii TaxID=1852022 RepID=UPI0032EAB02A